MFGHTLCLIVVLVVAYVALTYWLLRNPTDHPYRWVEWGDGHLYHYANGDVSACYVYPTPTGFAVALPGRRAFKRRFDTTAAAMQFARRLCA